MDQEKAAKIGMACQAIACVLGGVGVAVAFVGLANRVGGDDSLSNLFLPLESLISFFMAGITVWSLVAKPKACFTAAQKKSRAATLSFVLLAVGCINVWSLLLSPRLVDWKSSQYLFAMGALLSLTFLLQSLGSILRSPATDAEVVQSQRQPA